MLNLLGEAACRVFAETESAPPSFGLFPALLFVAVMFYFFMLSGDRKKQKAHRLALEALKKNDRVVTIGGIYGVVTNVQRETDEVTIKVDETTNAKLRVTLSAIARVVGEDSTTTDKSTKSST